MIKSGKDIIFASKLIKEGKLVAFPTETVYGLGANGMDAKAVAQIFEVKQRPSFDPLILHISSIEMLKDIYKKKYPSLIDELAEKYWPGPFSIVFNKNKKVPDIVTAGLETVAVRMPNHPTALKLIKRSGTPIAAPSANLFGRLSPTEAKHVKRNLSGVDYLLEGGATTVGLESTIVSVVSGKIEILRPGAITPEQIKKDFPNVEVLASSTETHIQAPGQLKSHYSPKKPFYLIDELSEEIDETSALLLFKPIDLPDNFKGKGFLLSETGDLTEGAAKMFSVFHSLQEDDEVQKIFALSVPLEGVGVAIMDRLRKASYRFTHLTDEQEIDL